MQPRSSSSSHHQHQRHLPGPGPGLTCWPRRIVGRGTSPRQPWRLCARPSLPSPLRSEHVNGQLKKQIW
uniref:Uncharacterized protein n=1 Tax=Arundo donax TaxID=35708 RepID=A0A0A9QQ35_ARUDO